jgi:hypothetical protein
MDAAETERIAIITTLAYASSSLARPATGCRPLHRCQKVGLARSLVTAQPPLTVLSKNVRIGPQRTRRVPKETKALRVNADFWFWRIVGVASGMLLMNNDVTMHCMLQE